MPRQQRWAERTLNKSQHTKLTLEKKILPPLLLGFELATFKTCVRCCYYHGIKAWMNYIVNVNIKQLLPNI